MVSAAWLRRLWPLLSLIGLGLALAPAAWADAPGRVGRLADLRGAVWLYDVDAGEWVAAQRNRPLTSGDRLATERDGQAELRIGSTTVRLAASTDLELSRLDDERMVLDLHGGSVAVRVRQRDVVDEVELRTEEGRFLPQRVGHYRVDRSPQVSSAGVWSGSLRFDSHDSTLVLGTGQRAEFWQEGGVSHYTWSALSRDRFADWALAEDERDERIGRARHVSPEMTGHEDLDRHGRWDRHPEFGVVWVPVHVSAGWAPYRYGQWVWRSPWGWTWVDDAPWGFAPFHYGRWASWQGRWVWVPGTYVSRPAYAPALVGWIGGSGVNLSIHIGGGPVVGWVPLSPYDIYRPGFSHRPDYWRRVNPQVPDPRRAPPSTGPIMYTNQGVPGGVTVVPANALRPAQPIAGLARGADERTVRELARQGTPSAPPPPAAIGASGRVFRPVTPPEGGVQRPARGADSARDAGAEGRTWRPPSALPPPPRADQPAPSPRSVEGPSAPQRVTPPVTGRGDAAEDGRFRPGLQRIERERDLERERDDRPPPGREGRSEGRIAAPPAAVAAPPAMAPIAPSPVVPAPGVVRSQPAPVVQPAPAAPAGVVPLMRSPQREERGDDGRSQRPADPGEGRGRNPQGRQQVN